MCVLNDLLHADCDDDNDGDNFECVFNDTPPNTTAATFSGV